ncbi:hypothetical protein CCO02nite_19150 [Cellulomonas composti]|uniref:DUF2510 domain-containing protein n=1 Tax=Cellulomonas composti TaxID=266130 RepID=A0A511JB97_9CELL|nr:hypothetical protein CCO02nite_19150 [Cellulomonas composti]
MDGETPGVVRWFDGAGWTEHTQPLAPAAGVPAPRPSDETGPGSAVHWLVPVGRSWQSVTAGYVGLFSLLVWPLGPVAIGLGVWALVRARHGGHGRGRAIFAIVAGVVATGAGLMWLDLSRQFANI